MRLESFYIYSYRVLRDLQINFSPSVTSNLAGLGKTSYALDFLVGINGTGKSTVLRALADIMHRLDQQRRSDPYIPYRFELVYELETNKRVKLSTLPAAGDDEIQQVPQLQVEVNGERQKSGFDANEHLPPLIIAFTTGSEAEWTSLELPKMDERSPESILGLSILERSIRELPGRPTEITKNEKPEGERRFRLIHKQQLPLVVLCGLLSDLAQDKSKLREVLSEVGIKPLQTFSLRFRLNQGITKSSDRREVIRIAEYATRILRSGSDYLLVFDLTRGQEHNLPQRLLTDFSGGLALFKILADLATVSDTEQPVLQEVNIFLNDTRREQPVLLLFDHLSDGEQSFLGRMCLLSLLGNDDALILLDEPEVHFNDFWKRKIVYLLDRVLEDKSSHLLITTHSSITLTDVPQGDIVLLRRRGDRTFTKPILRKTFASDPGEILVHVFEAPYPTGELSSNYIEQMIDASNESELRKLLDIVGQGYWSYLIRRELQAIEQK